MLGNGENPLLPLPNDGQHRQLWALPEIGPMKYLLNARVFLTTQKCVRNNSDYLTFFQVMTQVPLGCQPRPVEKCLSFVLFCFPSQKS